MAIAMLEEFRQRILRQYRLTALSIYGSQDGAFALLCGSPLPEPVLAEYRTYTAPKYIVREGGGCLLAAPGVRSRLVWHTSLNGQPFLIVLDSAAANAFDGSAGELLQELRGLKGGLQA